MDLPKVLLSSLVYLWEGLSNARTTGHLCSCSLGGREVEQDIYMTGLPYFRTQTEQSTKNIRIFESTCAWDLCPQVCCFPAACRYRDKLWEAPTCNSQTTSNPTGNSVLSGRVSPLRAKHRREASPRQAGPVVQASIVNNKRHAIVGLVVLFIICKPKIWPFMCPGDALIQNQGGPEGHGGLKLERNYATNYVFTRPDIPQLIAIHDRGLYVLGAW